MTTTKNQSETKHFGNQTKKDHINHLTVVMTGPQTPETNTLETKTLETNTLETNTLETNTLETNTDHNIEIKDNAQKNYQYFCWQISRALGTLKILTKQQKLKQSLATIVLTLLVLQKHG